MRAPTSSSFGSVRPMISCASCLSMPAHEPEDETIVRSRPAERSASHSSRTDFVAPSNRPLDCWARPQQPCLGTSTS